MQLGDIKVGQCGRIVAMTGRASLYRNRLISLGLIPGTVFRIVRMAPLGDPIEIWVRGSSLILRKSEAAIVSAEPL